MLDSGGARHISDAEARVDARGGAEDIAFDADGIQKVIDEINRVIGLELRKAKRDASHLFRDLPTDVDPVSYGYVRSVNTFGDGYEQWADELVERLQRYVDKLEKIKKNYLARDDEMASELSKVRLDD